jgi:translation initiation factor IF-1
MEVECKDIVIKAKSLGKLLNRNIKIMVGDRVKVGVSPYDPSHGIVTWRFR